MAQSITLQTSDDDVVASDVLGRLSFAASNDSSGGDAILIGGSIYAMAEATFNAVSNPTSIIFATASSESATPKLKIESQGHFVPINNEVYDLGTSSYRFRNTYSQNIETNKIVFVSGSVPPVSIENSAYNINGELFFSGSGVALLPSGGTEKQILQKVNTETNLLQWVDNYATELRVYVKNTTGSSLNKGQVVYINSAQGDHPTIALAIASGESTSSKTLGLLYQNLGINEFGYVVAEGTIENLDTSGAGQAGDLMYLSPTTPGGIVYGLANKPIAPNHMVFLGYVIVKQQNNGKVYVKVQNGFEIEELHNVRINGLSDGQYLVYNQSSGVWANSTVTPGGGGTTISNAADNRLLTSDGTSTGINAESNLTFSGSTLTINSSTAANLIINGNASASEGPVIYGQANSSNEWLICSQRGLLGGSALGLGLYVYNAYPMSFWTNNSERMRITSAGNVGIGTSSPPELLSVFKDNNGGRTSILIDNLDQRLKMSCYYEAGVGQYSEIQSTNNAETGHQVLILNRQGGNVGIGLNPSFKLDVYNGNIRSGYANNSALLVTANSTVSTGAAIAIQQTTGEGWTAIFADFEPYAEWGLYHDNPNNRFDFTAGDSTNSLRSYSIKNRTGNTATAYAKVSILQSSGDLLVGGSVGIGTSSPSQKLQIVGNATLSGSLTVSTANTTGGGIILGDDGDIVDLNDSFCSMRFTNGVRIFSGNRTGSAVITLGSNGTVTATTFSGSLSGNASTATNSTQLGGVAASNYFRVDGSYPNADMNVPVEGYWHVASNAANLPDGALYGHRWDYDHAGDGSWVAQFYTPTGGDAGLWFRQRRGGTWQAWRKFLDSMTYNSYSPTLTGGGASGTWGINVTGTAGGETLGTVTGRGASTASNITTTGAMYASNWYRSYGQTGWFNETYAGGIWMIDSTWVRVYNNKQFFADNIIQSAASVRAPIFYDSNDTNFYCDPNGTSRFASLVITSENLYVGDGVTNTFIRMRDSDEGERILHCNSNRIGFLNQSGGWGSWCEDDGSWATDFAVYAPIFYDRNNTGYYLDPASTSNLNRANLVGWDTSGRNYSREWIEFPNHSALYSPLNAAHFYPNNASYGAWRIAGTRNGWGGLEFDSTGAGQISLMMNSGRTGVHNNTYGWQWYWENAAFYVSKGAYGGGTIAKVLDSTNYSTYVTPRQGSVNAYASFDGSLNPPLIIGSYNVVSVVRATGGDAGTGKFQINLATGAVANNGYSIFNAANAGSTFYARTSITTSKYVIGVQTVAGAGVWAADVSTCITGGN